MNNNQYIKEFFNFFESTDDKIAKKIYKELKNNSKNLELSGPYREYSFYFKDNPGIKYELSYDKRIKITKVTRDEHGRFPDQQRFKIYSEKYFRKIHDFLASYETEKSVEKSKIKKHKKLKQMEENLTELRKQHDNDLTDFLKTTFFESRKHQVNFYVENNKIISGSLPYENQFNELVVDLNNKEIKIIYGIKGSNFSHYKEFKGKLTDNEYLFLKEKMDNHIKEEKEKMEEERKNKKKFLKKGF